MKKLVALMLVGAMTAAMVTGCGSSADTSASTDAAAEDTAADAEATEDTAEAAEDTAADAKSDLAYVKEKGTLVVGITEFEPMDYKMRMASGSDSMLIWQKHSQRALV